MLDNGEKQINERIYPCVIENHCFFILFVVCLVVGTGIQVYFRIALINQIDKYTTERREEQNKDRSSSSLLVMCSRSGRSRLTTRSHEKINRTEGNLSGL